MSDNRTRKNAIQLPILIVDFIAYNLTTLLDQELSDLSVKISLDMADIDRQLFDASVQARENKVYAPTTWFSKMIYMKRLKGQQIQCINTERGARTKKAKITRSQSIDSYFVAEAKIALSAEAYLMIMESAKRMIQKVEENNLPST